MRPFNLQPAPSDPTAQLKWCLEQLRNIANASQVDKPVDVAKANATLYQPLSAILTAIAALAATAYGEGFLTLANAAAARTYTGLVIGTNVEAWSANLDAWSLLATSSKLSVSRTTHGDANVTLAAADCPYTATSAALTAARTWTLPLANSVPAGHPIHIEDEAGGITATNTLTIQRQSTDTFNGIGVAANAITLTQAFSSVIAVSNGSNGWTLVGLLEIPLTFTPLNPANNLSDVASVTTSRNNLIAEKIGTFTGLNTQSASYTLVLTDAGKVVEMNVAGANTLTVPTDASVAFPFNTYINIHQLGAGQTTVTAAGGVTIRSRVGLKMFGQFSIATLFKRATNDWVLGGDLSA